MTKKIPVEGHPSLVRDASTGAVLNINTSSISAARKAKALRLAEVDRLNRVESELSEIKALLKKIIDG